MNRFHHFLKKYWILTLSGFFSLWLSIIPIRLAIASYQAPRPQAILTLGGDIYREKFTAEFAKNFPNLDIWISGGSPPETARSIFRAAGIPDRRLHLDYQAVDTVTNFTTTASYFKKSNIQHIYLITSDYHMPRSTAIATIILGSQGITFTPLSVSSSQPQESTSRIIRDVGRSLLWVFTGRTGSSLKLSFQTKFYAFR
ncbi:MAG: YdcF family protein [Calothrix sp. C42_A2020_038]|nr:YdcF family protein [Calothrix sp. C42_A2020_038]